MTTVNFAAVTRSAFAAAAALLLTAMVVGAAALPAQAAPAAVFGFTR